MPFTPPSNNTPDEPTIWGLINPLIRNRWLVVGVPLLVGLLVFAVLRSAAPRWTSTASFLPSSSDGRSSVPSLAQQIGLVAVSDAGQNSQFYGRLLRSRQLLRSVVAHEYSVTTDSGVVNATLTGFLDVDQDLPPARRAEAAVSRLAKAVKTDVDALTGLVTLSVTMPLPELAQQTAARMIESVNDFNNRRMREQAAARRQFTGALVDSAELALRSAENRLESFTQRNRAYAGNPQLVLERDRLQREVEFRQDLYTSIATSHEQARIEAMRDTPLITMVEPPLVPLQREPRRAALQSLAAMALTMLLMTFVAFGRESLARSRRSEPDEYATFRRLRDETVRDLRRIVAPFKRRSKTAELG